MSDVGCRMSDVGCRMSDVGCRMSASVYFPTQDGGSNTKKEPPNLSFNERYSPRRPPDMLPS
ncbi:MAG TPA: hypothetical protein DDZ09_00495 [Alcaligenes faecalis]|nr:hypothetical protein [Alcaligenes faecalis]